MVKTFLSFLLPLKKVCWVFFVCFFYLLKRRKKAVSNNAVFIKENHVEFLTCNAKCHIYWRQHYNCYHGIKKNQNLTESHRKWFLRVYWQSKTISRKEGPGQEKRKNMCQSASPQSLRRSWTTKRFTKSKSHLTNPSGFYDETSDAEDKGGALDDVHFAFRTISHSS